MHMSAVGNRHIGQRRTPLLVSATDASSYRRHISNINDADNVAFRSHGASSAEGSGVGQALLAVLARAQCDRLSHLPGIESTSNAKK